MTRNDSMVMGSQIFSFGSRIVHNEAVCADNGELLTVITPLPQWAYAVEFPSDSRSSVPKNGGVVKVQVRMHEGEIGLGLLAADGGSFVCEAQVAANEESELVEIPMPKGAVGSLVLRNFSSTGKSKAEIKFLGCDIPPTPAEPYWAASRITHGRAVCKREGNLLHITTPQEQWARAVELLPQTDTSIRKTGGVLKINLRVHEGEIGLGLLAPDNARYVCEAQVGASEERELIEIPLPKGSVGSLMVRNVSATGKSKADIELLGCDLPPAPLDPYWTALRIIHKGAVCKRYGNLLHITTPPERWANAVELPPQPDASVLEVPMVIKVQVKVHDGEVGLGVLRADVSYSREVRVRANLEGDLVEIPLPAGMPLGSLIVRNASAAGKSAVDVELVGFEIAPTPEDVVIDPALFAPFKTWSGFAPAGFYADWTGILTQVDVWVDWPESPEVPLDPHALDWAALAKAISESGSSFRMAAFGAGWGRWLAAGAALATQTARDYRLLGLEAEPQHFQWMLRHFKQNNISEGSYIALNAAAVGKPGDCWFAVGNSRAWYGQSVIREGDPAPEGAELRRTRGVTIDEALDLLSPLDYLQLDIQGAELEVLSYRPNRLHQEVRLINIGTHSFEIEAGLRKLFRRLGWECIYDIELGSKHALRLGDRVVPEVKFGDGVQVWRNPALVIK